MFIWVAAVLAFLAIWLMLWKNNLLIAFGVLIGLLIAWMTSFAIKPYVTGMESIPVWLPPLPLATVALVLFVYGALVWVRGNEALPQKKSDEAEDHHH